MSDFDSEFQHLSIFESKALQSVRLWLMKFKTCPILSWKFRNTSKSRKSCIQKFTWFGLFRKIDIFCPLRAFSKAFFWKNNSVHFSQICQEKSQNVSGCEKKGLQRVITWIESFKTCQFLNWKSYHVSFSELGQLKSFNFWNEK